MPRDPGKTGLAHPRRRLALVSAIAVVALVVGGSVAITRTSWWGCRMGTQADAADLEFTAVEAPERRDALARQIADVPGVGSLTAAAALDVDVRLIGAPGGSLLVSEHPYHSERNAFHDTSIDPTTGQIQWSRGHAGQVDTPLIAGDAVLSVAAVDGDAYRLTILEADNGSVRGCLDVDRPEGAGIGRTASTVTPDGSGVLLATPRAQRTAVAAYSVEDRAPLWQVDVPYAEGRLQITGTTAVLGAYERREFVGVASNDWTVEEELRTSLHGLDLATGETLWTWPQHIGDDDPPIAGASVPFFNGPEDTVVIVSEQRAQGGESEAHLRAVDATTGQERWSLELATVPDVAGAGNILLTLLGDVLTGVDVTTGKKLWSVPASGGASGPRPDLAQPWGENLLVVTGSGLTIIDPATGELTEIPLDSAYALSIHTTETTLAVTIDDSLGQDLLLFSREG